MVFNQIYYLLTENYLGAMIEYYKKFLLNFIIFFKMKIAIKSTCIYCNKTYMYLL